MKSIEIEVVFHERETNQMNKMLIFLAFNILIPSLIG